MNKEEIWDLYLPKEEEILFNYMKKYKSLIIDKKEIILNSDKKLAKFALVTTK